MLVQLDVFKKLLIEMLITRSPFELISTNPVAASNSVYKNALKRVVPFRSARVPFLFLDKTSSLNVGPTAISNQNSNDCMSGRT